MEIFLEILGVLGAFRGSWGKIYSIDSLTEPKTKNNLS